MSVTVVIPCYNHGRYVGDAIESVLRQTWPEVEVIVVDDGSTDNTAEVVRKYDGVRYIHQRNTGLAAARNAGARAGGGTHFVFLDADDRLTRGAIESGMKCFERNPGAGLVYGQGVMFDDGGAFADPTELAEPGPDPYEHLLRSNYLWMIHMSLYERSAIEDAGLFDSGVDAAADYGLNLKIARARPVAMHRDLVAECRYVPGSMSRNLPLMLSSVLRVLDMQKPYVAGNSALLRAWRIGRRNWKLNFTRLMLHQVKADLQQRQASRSLLPNVAALARYGPGVAMRSAARSVKALKPGASSPTLSR